MLPLKSLILMTTLASLSVCDSSLSHTSTLRLRVLASSLKRDRFLCHNFTESTLQLRLSLRGGLPEYPLSSLINSVIFADTNLISEYLLNAAWKANVDDQKQKGLTIYVTPTVLKEYSLSPYISLPAGFQPLVLSKVPVELENILSALSAVLNLTDNGAKRFRNDLTILVEACCSVQSIAHIFKQKSGKYLFATKNMIFLKRCLGNAEKRALVRTVLEQFGFDLIPAISVTDVTFQKFYWGWVGEATCKYLGYFQYFPIIFNISLF